MRTLPLLLSLAILPGMASAQQNPSPEQDKRQEDVVKRDLLFLGTEFGLYVSIDGGKTWAQFKGNRFPAVAVRDLAIQPRDNDLVLATHGRGIWIVDDITPWRALTPDLLPQEATFVSARPVQQRIQGGGGWANGDAVFIGDIFRARRSHRRCRSLQSKVAHGDESVIGLLSELQHI